MATQPTFQSEFQQLGYDLKSFLETRYELLRAELAASLARIRNAAMLIAAAAVLGIPALILLGVCASLAVAYGLGAIPNQAGLIGGFLVIGGCGLIFAGIAGAIGIGRLKARDLAPRHTLHVLRRDGESFQQGGEPHDHESSSRRSA